MMGMGNEDCRVYWGSHGCKRTRGHEGLHECDCCECPDHVANDGLYIDEDGEETQCVATWPYYGPDTQFHGEDSVTLPAAV